MFHRINLPRKLRAYLLPATVFQSVIFGGAYGTGREVAEFITRHGATGGLQATAMAAVVLSVILFLTFECARQFDTRNYQAFFKALIGPGWVVYEVLFVVMLLLVLAVNTSASHMILGSIFHSSHSLAVVAFVVLTFVLLSAGRRTIESVMMVGVIVLATTLLASAGLVISDNPSEFMHTLSSRGHSGDWAFDGFRFALYNAAAIPVLLYAIEAIETRKEALISGLVAGFAGVLPAMLLHLMFIQDIPAVTVAEFPLSVILANKLPNSFLMFYAALLFLMVILTAVGLLHGLIERIRPFIQLRTLPLRLVNLVIPLMMVLLSLILAQFGIIALVASGYGTIAWAFLVVYLMPLLWVSFTRVLRVK